jgi:hypothetical protein
VSCYTRQLGDLLPANPTGADKRALDAAIRQVLDATRDQHCPEVWAKVKERREDPAFASAVRAQLGREA